MSRIAKAPINVPAGVEVTLKGQDITVKGKNGELTRTINDAVEVQVNDNVITTLPREGETGSDRIEQNKVAYKTRKIIDLS